MITIYYSCKGCQVHEQGVKVKARASEEMNVLVWLEADVMPIVKADHARASPGCACPMASLRFPFDPGALFVGQQTEGDPYFNGQHQFACPLRHAPEGKCACDPKELPKPVMKKMLRRRP